MSPGEMILEYIGNHSSRIANSVYIIQALFTTAAIVAGIWWFIIRRLHISRANISHKVTFTDIGKDVLYVGIQVTMDNIGNVRIKTKPENAAKNIVIIEELSPYLGVKQESQELSPEYKLRLLGARTFPAIISIEPSESQTTLFEFIVRKEVEAIKVYSYIDNGYNKGIGWNRTTIHEVNNE